MAVRNPRKVLLTGSAPVEYPASGGGDSITNGQLGDLFVTVRNDSDAAINVTVGSPKKCNQGGTHNLVVAVPAGASRDIGPLPSSRFGAAVGLTYSAAADLYIDPQIVPN